MATRYHLLPSEVMLKADTLDLLVMDAAEAWHRQQRQELEAKHSGKPVAPQNIPVTKLKQMMDAVRKNEPKTNQK